MKVIISERRGPLTDEDEIIEAVSYHSQNLIELADGTRLKDMG